MVKPRKLTGTEKTIQITRIIMYAIGIFIGISLLFFALEYFGFFEELRLKFAEMMNL